MENHLPTQQTEVPNTQEKGPNLSSAEIGALMSKVQTALSSRRGRLLSDAIEELLAKINS